MAGKFVFSNELELERLDWGQQVWLSRPGFTQAESLVIAEVELFPDFGHTFHKHPQQEELIYVLNGEVEQWIETDKQILQAGDSVFIGADTVHATFNISDRPLKVLAILGPSIGEEGYEVIEVADQEPWKSLRT